MRKITGIFILILAFTWPALAVDYPVLPQEGESLQHFVPQGWRIIDSAKGDLNGDKIADAAFVLEKIDSAKEPDYGSGDTGTESRDHWEMTKPRILIIILQNAYSHLYYVSAQNNTFILRGNEGGVTGDPFHGRSLAIEKGALHIYFEGGSYEKWHVDYIFKFEKGKWNLIGAESAGFDQNENDGKGGGEIISYNFHTHKAKITTMYSLFEDNPSKKDNVKWIDLPYKGIKTLNDLKHPFLWEIMPGKYL